MQNKINSMLVEIDPDSQTARGERMLRESGNSVVLTIPPQILQQAGLSAGDEVEIVSELGSGVLTITELADEGSEDETE